MSRNKNEGDSLPPDVDLNLSVVQNSPPAADKPSVLSRLVTRRVALGSIAICFLIVLGVFAKNGWLPRTDPLSGKKSGWFGAELPKHASSTWNPFAPPIPTPTPQLAKEYIYAGSRLLAVEDANANAAPPADLAVWRPSNGTFYVLGGPGSAQVTYAWGYCPSGNPADVSCDKPTQGDYDGDGKTDFSIYRPSTGVWYIVPSSTGSYYTVTLGAATDLPAVADYDGDGKTDVAVFRPSTGAWYILQSSNGGQGSPTFGTNGDKPVPADYDGDGRADVAVWRNSNLTFYSLNTINNGSQSLALGSTNDIPVSGDYDGDGKVDFALFTSASTAVWTVRQSSNGQLAYFTYGTTGDVPVPNDYDGDGKCDRAIFRPASSAQWWIRKSSTGTDRNEYWGTTGDIPVPAYYRP
jgi:hypothetical protein